MGLLRELPGADRGRAEMWGLDAVSIQQEITEPGAVPDAVWSVVSLLRGVLT